MSRELIIGSTQVTIPVTRGGYDLMFEAGLASDGNLAGNLCGLTGGRAARVLAAAHMILHDKRSAILFNLGWGLCPSEIEAQKTGLEALDKVLTITGRLMAACVINPRSKITVF